MSAGRPGAVRHALSDQDADRLRRRTRVGELTWTLPRQICGSALIPVADGKECLFYLVRGQLDLMSKKGKRKRDPRSNRADDDDGDHDNDDGDGLEGIGVWVPYRSYPCVPWSGSDQTTVPLPLVDLHQPTGSANANASSSDVEAEYETTSLEVCRGFSAWTPQERFGYTAQCLHYCDIRDVEAQRHWWGLGMGWVHLRGGSGTEPSRRNDDDNDEVEITLKERLQVAIRTGNDRTIQDQQSVKPLEREGADPADMDNDESATLGERHLINHLSQDFLDAVTRLTIRAPLASVIRAIVQPFGRRSTVWFLQDDMRWAPEELMFMSDMVRFTFAAFNSPAEVFTLPPIALPLSKGHIFSACLPQVVTLSRSGGPDRFELSDAKRMLRGLAWRIHRLIESGKYGEEGEFGREDDEARQPDEVDEDSDDDDGGYDGDDRDDDHAAASQDASQGMDDLDDEVLDETPNPHPLFRPGDGLID